MNTDIKKKILITGAYGFIGTNLSNYLIKQNNEYEITALDLYDGSLPAYSKYYSWDECDFISWDEYHAIIHLAGKAHDTANTSNPDSYFEINYGLTKIAFTRFLKSSAKIFIFFSSVKAIADSVLGDSLLETDVPNPLTPYGQSKLAAEKYILEQGVPTGKQVYILRPAMIHGPGNKGNLNLLYSMVKSGMPYPLGTFHNQRSFTSVDNLLYILKKLMASDVLSGVYNVCDDVPLSTIQIVEMICDSLGKKRRILSIPKPLIQILASLGDILRLPLNSERLKKLTESYLVSNAKIKVALNIEYLPNSSQSGMTKTLRSFSRD